MSEEKLENTVETETVLPQTVPTEEIVAAELPTPEKLEFSYETKSDDLLEAVEAYDRKHRLDTHRNIELMGVIVVLWMFVPGVFQNPERIMGWVMVAIAVALLVFILKYPAIVNKRFAARRVETAPLYQIVVTQEGIDITEGGGHYFASFAEGCTVCDYKGVYACWFDRNRVIGIPKNQLDEDTRETLCAMFRQGLGDRFEKMSEQQKGFSRPKK